MPIQFSCRCGKTLQVEEVYAGKEAACPVCGTPNRIPEPAATVQYVTEAAPYPMPPPVRAAWVFPRDGDEKKDKD